MHDRKNSGHLDFEEFMHMILEDFNSVNPTN